MKELQIIMSDYTFIIVALGAGLLGIVSGVLGCFANFRKQSLLGDGVSHSALPGIVVAFIILQTKNTEFMLIGALLSGLLATFLIMVITTVTKIKFDSALAMVMSVFFGIGLVLLTYVQGQQNSAQAGLDRFIYGQAAGIMKRDVYFIAICGVILLVLIIMFWKEFKLISFDMDFGKSIGLPVKFYSGLLSFMFVVAIVLGLQTVGVILVSAILISPSVAARQWTNKTWLVVILSGVFGGVCGVIGTAWSSLIPKIPTGPAIVVCVSVIVIFSILFGTKRGVVSKIHLHAQNRKKWKGEQLC